MPNKFANQKGDKNKGGKQPKENAPIPKKTESP